jgi:hypothetical protein
MKMKPNRLATTLTLSAVAAAMATSPSLAIGGIAGPLRPGAGNVSVATPVSNPPPPPGGAIAQPFQPGAGNVSVATPVSNPAPAPGGTGAVPYQPGAGNPSINLVPFTVQYSPSALNLGVVKTYVSWPTTAVLTVTSPTDGTVTAALETQAAFQVTRLTRYQFVIPAVSVYGGGGGGGGTGLGGSLASARPRERMESVAGNAGLAVKAGDQVEVEVSLQATTSMFRYPRATLKVRGAEWHISVPVGASIIHYPEIDPSIPGELKIAPGGVAELPVRLNRTLTGWTNPPGLPRTVTIKAQNLPAGVTMEPVSVLVPNNVNYVDTVLRFRADAAAPVRRDQLTRLLVNSGADREQFDLAGHVYPTQVSWSYSQKSGDVLHTGTLTIRSDGTWEWKASLHDNGAIYGDYYGVSVWLNMAPTEEERRTVYQAGHMTRPATFENGSLGGGLLGGSNEKSIDRSSSNDPYNPGGANQWLRKYYIAAVDAGVTVQTRNSHNLGPVIEWSLGLGWKLIFPD